MDFSKILQLFALVFRFWREQALVKHFRLKGLTSMIRATRGRSRRPNHMHSHLDALQAMGPVAFRRVASEVHSVAKRASFYIAFGRDFCGFRIDFGRFGGG